MKSRQSLLSNLASVMQNMSWCSDMTRTAIRLFWKQDGEWVYSAPLVTKDVLNNERERMMLAGLTELL